MIVIGTTGSITIAGTGERLRPQPHALTGMPDPFSWCQCDAPSRRNWLLVDRVWSDMLVSMLIRREHANDLETIDAIHRAAFAGTTEPEIEPVEVNLVRALRADESWVPALSLVAEGRDGSVIGHVVATTASLPGCSAVGLGPIGVLPEHQSEGVGAALMHAVLGAADALDVAVVVLLGHTDYYPRFGFQPAAGLGIIAPDPTWEDHFQARTLTTWTPDLGGEFRYAAPFDAL